MMLHDPNKPMGSLGIKRAHFEGFLHLKPSFLGLRRLRRSELFKEIYIAKSWRSQSWVRDDGFMGNTGATQYLGVRLCCRKFNNTCQNVESD
jgi:hypothetical protein